MDDQVVVNQANQASQVPVVAPVQPAPTGAEAHVAVVSPTPVIPVLEKKSKKKLFLIIAIVILVLVLLGLGGYFGYKKLMVKPVASPSPEPTVEPTPTATSDPTVGWETYVNSKYGYSLQYPRQIEIESQNNKFTDDLIEINGIDSLVIRVEPVQTLESDPEKWWETQTVESYTQQSANCFSKEKTATIKSLYDNSEIIKIFDDKVLLLYDFGNEENGCNEPPNVQILLISHNGKLLKVTYDWAIQSEQILSTFEFVDNEESGSCSLSLCDCKCYPTGETREETEGVMCGINCLGEHGVSGCEFVNGVCSAI